MLRLCVTALAVVGALGPLTQQVRSTHRVRPEFEICAAGRTRASTGMHGIGCLCTIALRRYLGCCCLSGIPMQRADQRAGTLTRAQRARMISVRMQVSAVAVAADNGIDAVDLENAGRELTWSWGWRKRGHKRHSGNHYSGHKRGGGKRGEGDEGKKKNKKGGKHGKKVRV
jgi:hypothetical protein